MLQPEAGRLRAKAWTLPLVFALFHYAMPAGAVSCDDGLALADTDPMSGAFAIELCELSVAGSPGLIDASYVAADGTTPLDSTSNGLEGVGLLDELGPMVAPQAGQRMLALSSGSARAPTDPGFTSSLDKGYLTAHAPGFPYQPAAVCPVPGAPHDSAALNVTLKVPSTAQSFSFRFKFHTRDYPTLACTSFADWFVASVDPAPVGADPVHKNVVFDSMDGPATAHSAEFMRVCAACPAGDAELMGTGFEGTGATSWMRTSVPVVPDATISILFAIWDSGDGVSDSTVLLDDFRWSSAPRNAPLTVPVPEPLGPAGPLAILVAWAGRIRRRRD